MLRLRCSPAHRNVPYKNPLCRHSSAARGLQQIILLLGAVITVAQISQTCANTEPELYTYEIVAEMPHDPTSFTQGLQFDKLCLQSEERCKDIMWESTGLNGESKVRAVEVDTGKVVKETKLEARWFGEGLVRLKDRLYQMTWLTPTTLVYDTDLKQVGTLESPLGDGWGFTTDGHHLIASDGSHKLYWMAPDTLKVEREVEVQDMGRNVPNLNELEMVEGEVWANVWMSPCIARIDPQSGAVKGWLLLDGLHDALVRRRLPQPRPMDVLNGIAYDRFTKRVFVTGKLWPRMFEIKVHPMTPAQKAAASTRACHTQPNNFRGY